jgi:hypothetical protein
VNLLEEEIEIVEEYVDDMPEVMEVETAQDESEIVEEEPRR